MNTASLRLAALLALLTLPVTAFALDLDCRYAADRKGASTRPGRAHRDHGARR